MQAILTTIIPATLTKPTRVKAQCERGSIIVTYDNLCGTGADKHIAAAKILCARFAREDKAKNGTPLNLNNWSRHFFSGELNNGKGVAHVFVDYS